MTYEVQQTRWDRIIRRVSGSIGPGSRVSETLSELFPVVDVERVPGELLLLGGTIPSFASAVVTSGVGQFPAVQLFNPLLSGVLVTVSKVYISSTQAQTILWDIDAVQIGTLIANAPRSRDLRMLFPSQPVARLSISSALGAPIGGFGQLRVGPNANLSLTDDNGVMVMPPGAGMSIGGGVANSTILITYLWRERPAEESELQF